MKFEEPPANPSIIKSTTALNFVMFLVFWTIKKDFGPLLGHGFADCALLPTFSLAYIGFNERCTT
jgi:hypothetical protein